MQNGHVGKVTYYPLYLYKTVNIKLYIYIYVYLCLGPQFIGWPRKPNQFAGHGCPNPKHEKDMFKSDQFLP